MKRIWLTRLMAAVLAAAILACGPCGGLRAEAQEPVEALGARFQSLIREGKYDDAAQVMQQIIAVAEQQLGADDPSVAAALDGLGTLYVTQNRYGEAEPFFRRALAIREKTLGPDHPDVATVLVNLAKTVQALSRYAEAEALMRRAVEIQEKALGPDHPDLAATLNLLGNYKVVQSQMDEAERLFLRALAIREKALGPDDQTVAQTLNSLATVYQHAGRYNEAEAIEKRSLSILEKILPADHPDVAFTLNGLAQIYFVLGRYEEAEPYFKRSEAILEKAYGMNERHVAVAIGNLAVLYQAQGRINEAAPLFLRTVDILQKTLGPDHVDVAAALNNTAFVYHAVHRYDDAADLFKRAIAILEKALGSEHPSVAVARSNLGEVYNDADRPAEAEPLLRQAAAAMEKALGPDHLNTGTALNNLAYSLHRLGRDAEALPLYERGLGIVERALGPDHPDVSVALDNLGSFYFEQGQLEQAAGYWRRATKILIHRTQRGTETTGTRLVGKAKSEIQRESYRLASLIKTLHRLPQPDPASGRQLLDESFSTAQWALGSDTAETLAQMAARGAKGDAALSQIVRERQDLVGEWQLRDKGMIDAVSKGAEDRDAKAEAQLQARLAAIDTRIGDIDRRLLTEFPDYSLLANPAPLSVEEVQAYLNPDEALVLFLDTGETKPAPEESFVWVVTKTDMRWSRLEPGTAALTREVRALRCGLDDAAWDAGDCGKLTGRGSAGARVPPPGPLPFDHARAHRLYKALFGPVEDLIEGKQLLLVPAGALTQLPFQVLVKTPPKNGNHKSADWLVRHNAISVLPAVSSLRALRRTAHASAAKKPLVGFGNPLLNGPDERYEKQAGMARAHRTCAAPKRQQTASAALPRAVLPIEKIGTLISPAAIRFQPPLPETADELCAVARNVNAEPGDIHLGANATEREVKALSASGALAQYRIVHFATHGAMAGQLRRGVEPGLILTPPVAASELDDGYLSSSEIAALRLDADWVILSACNTAAGNAADAEALSGLARAFFYAQARALLVSHWAVASDAAVKLVTTAMRELEQNRTIGRAEALRRAMQKLIETGSAREAHPSVWAPFIVVGEGAR